MLHHRSDKTLQELAKLYKPYIQGWINYYGNFYRTPLRPTMKRIDMYVIRWACHSPTVLGAPGGGSPPGDSTFASFWARTGPFRFVPDSGRIGRPDEPPVRAADRGNERIAE
jgi:hypothetical protein